MTERTKTEIDAETMEALAGVVMTLRCDFCRFEWSGKRLDPDAPCPACRRDPDGRLPEPGGP